MKKALTITIFTVFLTLGNSLATEAPNHCFPKSSLRFYPNEKSNNIDKNDYIRAQRNFESIFGPEILKENGKSLKFEDAWDESEVNAYCTRDMDDNPVIKVYGGMARHHDLSLDGLYLIFCHELGHYLGGAPKAFRGRTSKRSWSSAEGQADYYATSKCLKKVFDDERENESVIKREDSKLVEKAMKRCPKNDTTCIRSALASFSVAKVFHSVRSYEPFPEIDGKSSKVVRRTVYNHPTSQCRLDTFINGTNCKVDIGIGFDNIDPRVGACHRNSDKSDEVEAARPLCWYRPADKFE